MTDYTLPSHLLERLAAVARRENRTPADMLDALLREHEPPQEDDAGTLAELARAALEANMRAEGKDTARNSREILKGRYRD